MAIPTTRWRRNAGIAGGRLRVRMDWFCTVCIVLIAVTLLALAGYIMHHRVRMPSRPGAVEFIEPTP